jgi:phosphatidylserine/phosphatidylglycerophosphate/cardiolipin synthase-like enzyme
MGFSWEDSTLGNGGRFPVFIHHKFVVIDAENRTPTIFTGSANMSANSVFYNDENLIEITSCPRMAQIYLAEFMRLFEHSWTFRRCNRCRRSRMCSPNGNGHAGSSSFAA